MRLVKANIVGKCEWKNCLRIENIQHIWSVPAIYIKSNIYEGNDLLSQSERTDV